MSQTNAIVSLSLAMTCFTLFHSASVADTNTTTNISTTNMTSSGISSSDIPSSNILAPTTMQCPSVSAINVKVTTTVTEGSCMETMCTPATTMISVTNTTSMPSFIDATVTSVETSSTADPTLSELEWIEENWLALVIGVAVGLLLGCCVCSLPVVVLCCKRMKEVYPVEPDTKKSNVKLLEKTSVRVEEIPLESANNDGDATKEKASPEEGDSKPMDTNEDKAKSPSDVVIMVTADGEGETTMKDKKEEQRVSVSAEDPASTKPGDNGNTPSPVKSKKHKDKGKSHSKDKSKVHSNDKSQKTQSDVKDKSSSPTKDKASSSATNNETPSMDESTTSSTDKGKAPPNIENESPSTGQQKTGSSAAAQAETPSSLTKDKTSSDSGEEATSSLAKGKISSDEQNKKELSSADVKTKQAEGLEGQQRDSDAHLHLSAGKKVELTAEATTGSEMTKNQNDTPKDLSEKVPEKTVDGAIHSEKVTPSKQKPKESKTLPGTEDIDALLQDVLNWEMHS